MAALRSGLGRLGGITGGWRWLGAGSGITGGWSRRRAAGSRERPGAELPVGGHGGGRLGAGSGITGTLRLLLPIAQNNVSRSSSVMQLVSRFTTLNLCHVSSPTISTVTKLGSSMEYRFTCAHKLAALKSMTPQAPSFQQPARTLTYCSIRKGKRKTVKAVVKRFLRLHCGLWVRRKAGYKKKLWKKRSDRKRRLRQHVFCNKTQSKMLDKMTTKFWKRRNWYVNDPYQMYHDRTNLKV